MNKLPVFGLIISLLGSALWIYGYFTTGMPSLVNWAALTPWWIADFLPNIESEIGMVVACVGTVLSYWPVSRLN